MIKVQTFKNRNNVEYSVVDIGQLKMVGPKMYDMNDIQFSSGNFQSQCKQCAKGIKHINNSYQIICDYNTETLVKISDYDIAKDSPGIMDCFDLGPECARRVKKACKEAGVNWKDYIKQNNYIMGDK